MTRTFMGIVVGLALGFAVIFASFGEMLIVALFGALGWGVAKIIGGEVDLTSYISGRRGQ